MRVLIAPDCFGSTMTAAQAGEAMSSGWRRGAPGDEVIVRPMSDGGPGFLDVLRSVLGGIVHDVEVAGPLGAPVRAQWLQVDDTGYVESAQACGRDLAEPAVASAGTRGVGELVARVRDAGCRRVVVGIGGSASTDGGAGLLAALGAVAVDDTGTPLPPGGGELGRCTRLDGTVDVGELELVAAADVTAPLLGPSGAARGYGPQKGAGPELVERLEDGLRTWADCLAAWSGHDVADLEGAGAGGGLGAALAALGAELTPGSRLVADHVGVTRLVAGAQLVLTGEGTFDWQSLRGKVVATVAGAASRRGVPCLVLAGQVLVGRREAAAIGVDDALAVAELAGSVEESMRRPVQTLSALAERVAAHWGGQ